MTINATSPHPEWATSLRTKGTELRLLKGNYYLYSYSNVYDPIKKQSKKITGKLLGRITEKEGFIPSEKLQLRQQLQREQTKESKNAEQLAIKVGVHREWGVSEYILVQFASFLNTLQQYFKDEWQFIVLMAYCRLLYQCPIKNMPLHMVQSWLFEQWQPGNISEKKISTLLRTIGQKREEAIGYMKTFIQDTSYFLVDTTNILSKSSKIALAKKGYNSNMDFEPQISTMYLFSATNKMPVFYRINPGNIKEVKAFGLTLKESGIKDAVIIGDKGFYSKDNVTLFKEEHLQCILPIPRTNNLIDYTQIADGSIKHKKQYFDYQGRIIWYVVISDNTKDKDTIYKDDKDKNYEMLCLFLDEKYRNKEETDYLHHIDTLPEEFTWEKFQEKRNTFGTLAFLSILKKKSTPQQIYEGYKSRQAIEEMFDTLKNMLDVDSTYMQNEDALQGWMFINHIALQWFHQMYLNLKKKELLPKHSVKDILQLLLESRKVKINNEWYPTEITTANQKLISKVTKI